jgi:predicted DNA binding CopG/RHH family protein
MTSYEAAKYEVAKSRTPEFKSREEEAAWFDSHDVGDYLDEFEVVDKEDVQVAENLSNLTEGFTVRLSPEDVKAIRSQARKRGVGASTLVRMWIYEHLQKGGKNSNLGA